MLYIDVDVTGSVNEVLGLWVNYVGSNKKKQDRSATLACCPSHVKTETHAVATIQARCARSQMHRYDCCVQQLRTAQHIN